MKIREKILSHAALVIGCAILICCGCSGSPKESSATTLASPDRLITTNGVGAYIIGTSTLEDILGSDTPESRKLFAQRGLYFEFEQGKKLTGVTVTSNTYALKNGLSIGSTGKDVHRKLGEPRDIKIETLTLEFSALFYDNYTFFLDKSGVVTAIRVGR